MNEGAVSTSPILDTTADAIRLAKALIRTARSGALATLDPLTGAPLASRVGVATDIDGTPVILISALASHTGALRAEPRCSLLLGTPGEGDPLAHARITLACSAEEVERGSANEGRLGTRYLSHQPKASLYAGLGDFRYFRLTPLTASLNAGFGRAYALGGDEVLTQSGFDTALAAMEPGAVEHMNDDHAEAVGLYAEHHLKAAGGNWRLVTLDAEGFVIADGDDVRRIWFDTPLPDAEALRPALVRMAIEARRALGRPVYAPGH